MKILNRLGTGAATSLLVACASSPDKIDAAYVSPLKYESYSCKQIAVEMDYVGQETTKLYSELKDESTADAWQMGVGLVLFWPSLFFLEGGDGPQAAEYAQLSGEFEALRTVSVEKECGLAFNSPEEIIKSADRKESLAEIAPLTRESALHLGFGAACQTRPD